MKPKVTIIILNWNSFNDTKECLESVQKNNYPNFEIIVVDNNSNKQEADLIRKEFGDFVKVLKNKKNFGFSKGNNMAIQKAKGEYILLLNNDTIVKPNFLTQLIASQADLAAPKILTYPSGKISFTGGEINWFSRFIIKHLTGNFKKMKEFPFLTGCCLLIKKEVFKKIGLFDERFFLYYEDADFCLRAKKAGYKLILNPQAIIKHKISRSVKSESQIYHYYTQRNKLLLVKKHAPLIAKLYHYLNSLISLCYIKFNKKSKRLAAVEKGIKDFWKNKFYKL